MLVSTLLFNRDNSFNSSEVEVIRALKFCHVIGGKDNLDYHAWLSDITIQRLKIDGCKVIIINTY